jgi:excisionase family DNA binding protein
VYSNEGSIGTRNIYRSTFLRPVELIANGRLPRLAKTETEEIPCTNLRGEQIQLFVTAAVKEPTVVWFEWVRKVAWLRAAVRSGWFRELLPAARNMATESLQHPDLPKRLFSVIEAARILSLSRTIVYREIKCGRISIVRPTSVIRISDRALHGYVKLLEDEARLDQLSRRATAR